MVILSKNDFIDEVRKFDIKTEYAVVKPNWVSNTKGMFTEAEILDWLMEALPNQKKIIIESYTPWRGLKFEEDSNLKGNGVTLEGGKEHWDFYRKQDVYFLESTGNIGILEKYNTEYINITNEVWENKCVKSGIIKNIVENDSRSIKWTEFYSYFPQKLFEIREKSTFISLSKIKIEDNIPDIYVSMSVKNLFGLIPHPSRRIPFHGINHETVPEVIRDTYNIYTSLFKNTLWITEGIKTLVLNYCEPKQKVVSNQNLMFIGKDGVKVDTEACMGMGVDPNKVPYLNQA
jgi:hypothetical protein